MSNEKAAAQPNPNAGMSKVDLENKVKAMHNFRTAVRSGTFNGSVAPHIAALCGLLDSEHDAALTEYESQMAAHPEWGRPAEMAKAGASA